MMMVARRQHRPLWLQPLLTAAGVSEELAFVLHADAASLDNRVSLVVGGFVAASAGWFEAAFEPAFAA